VIPVKRQIRQMSGDAMREIGVLLVVLAPPRLVPVARSIDRPRSRCYPRRGAVVSCYRDHHGTGATM